MPPGSAAASSACARMRSLYSAVKDLRLASGTTSGSGRSVAGGSGATVLPAAVLRSVSLRSSSLRSATGKTEGEAEDKPLFFTLISVLALLSHYDRENCLINLGTEGAYTSPRRPRRPGQKGSRCFSFAVAPTACESPSQRLNGAV